MVILRNLIKTSDNIIECDYYPEDRGVSEGIKIAKTIKGLIDAEAK